MTKDLQVVSVKRKKRKPAKASKRPTRTSLIKKADSLMSEWVRRSHANRDGLAKCYTCEYVAPWKKLQNGHWIVRQYKYTRWDEDNTRPQCYACNFRFNGRPHIFRENLVNELGVARVQQLEARAKPLFKENDAYILDIIEKYKALLQSLNETSP